MQCDFEVPENLRTNFANFPAIFKNTLVSKSDIGDLMKNYAEEERLLSRPRTMLISSCTLQKRALISPLLLFYLHLGLVCTKIHRFFVASIHKNASIALCTHQWTQEGKMTKIQTQVSSQKQWSF